MSSRIWQLVIAHLVCLTIGGFLLVNGHAAASVVFNALGVMFGVRMSIAYEDRRRLVEMARRAREMRAEELRRMNSQGEWEKARGLRAGGSDE
jgi:hypothetical protein